MKNIVLEFYAKPLGKPPGPPPDAPPGQGPPQGNPGDDGGDKKPPVGGKETPQNKPASGSDSPSPPKEQKGGGGGGDPPKPFFDGTTCVTPIHIDDFINAMSVLYLKVGILNIYSNSNSDH